jgi:glycogen debranching enzyme
VLTDHVIVRDATMLLADRAGDIRDDVEPAFGLYHGDTRLLHRWVLALGDAPLVVAGTTATASERTVVLLPPFRRGAAPSAVLVREQRVEAGGLAERIVVHNPSAWPRRVEVGVDASADFADQFRLRSDGRTYPKAGARIEARPAPGGLDLCYARESRGRTFARCCAVRADPPARIVLTSHDDGVEDGGPAVAWSVRWDVEVPPHGSARLQLGVRRIGDARPAPPRTSPRRSPVADPTPGELAALRDRCLDDLDALTMPAPGRADLRVPAAGVPWFLTLFGRDSLLTAELACAERPELGPDVVRALAELRGSGEDPETLEQPGAIVHEVRTGELAELRDVPYRRYFGTVDATPLFLAVLGRLVARGDRALAVELEPAARDAVAWMRGPGGLDQHGWLVFRGDATGLANQGWKDSIDAVPYADGRLAQGRIALVEVQGYAVEALDRVGELALTVWGSPSWAAELRALASGLRRRLAEEFWLDRHDLPALALDGEGHQVDVLASNAGHLLWSGALDADRARRVADVLLGPRFFSGWGLRTLAAGQVPYAPLGYHTGSVWPHDTALAMLGMSAYGLHEHARRLATGLVSAAVRCGYRLPELFGGYGPLTAPVPVAYPFASSPQAWAAAAGLAAVRVLRS